MTSQSKEARKCKAALLVYYSMDSSSFQKNCEQSVEKSNLLLLKFTNLQLAEHFNYYILFCFVDLLYSLSLICSVSSSHSVSLSLCSLCSVSLPHSVSLSLLFSFSCSFCLIISLCLSRSHSLSHYLTRLLSLSLSHSLSDYLVSKGGWVMSDVIPLSGIPGLSPDSSFLSPLLFFCLVLLLFLSCHFSANGPFS